jgi:hypothetical protein
MAPEKRRPTPSSKVESYDFMPPAPPLAPYFQRLLNQENEAKAKQAAANAGEDALN